MRLYSQPQVPFTDSYLSSLIVKTAGFLQARAYEKGSKPSDFHWHWFPVKMEEGTSHGLDCYPGCQVMTSISKLPTPLNLRNRDMIKVSLLDGREMHYILPTERASKLLDEFFQNQYMFSVINGKVVVYSKKKPVVVWVAGLWSDMSEWMDIPACDPEGEFTGSNCLDPLNFEVPLDPDNVLPMYNEVLRLLQVPVSVKPDDINNASNTQ